MSTEKNRAVLKVGTAPVMAKIFATFIFRMGSG